MSSRKRIPRAIERELLIKSHRRCCLCYGIDGDITEKAGQIAHLDGNRNNNEPKNLAFLCLEHHDRFDSITSQSKGIESWEVVHYRDELYKTFDLLFTEPILTELAAIE